MPQGKGTYGGRIGRPARDKKLEKKNSFGKSNAQKKVKQKWLKEKRLKEYRKFLEENPGTA